MPKLDYFTLKKDWEAHNKNPNLDSRFRETCGRFNMSLYEVSEKLTAPGDKELRKEVEKYRTAAAQLQNDPREAEILKGISTMQNFPAFLGKKFGGKTAYERIMETLEPGERKFFNDDLQIAEHFTEWGIDLKELNNGKEPELPSVPSLVRWGLNKPEEVKEEKKDAPEEVKEEKKKDAPKEVKEEKKKDAPEDRTLTEEEAASCSALSEILASAAVSQHNKLRGKLGDKLELYSEQLKQISDQDQNQETIASGREKLGGLKKLLDQPCGRNGKTNYDVMCEELSVEGRMALSNGLQTVNDLFQLGIDTSNLEKGRKSKLSEQQRETERQEEEEIEAERRETQRIEAEHRQTQRIKAEPREAQRIEAESRRMRKIEAEQRNPVQRAARNQNMGETHSAFDWIESAQKDLKQLNPNHAGQQAEYIAHAAKIMAVRIAADAPRDKKSILKQRYVNESSIQAEKLAENKTFQKFMAHVLNDPKRRDKAHKALTKGHGGAFEDMFKEYVRDLPPGELSNDPELARYMPTAKDRIEHLQKCAEKAGDPNLSSFPDAILSTKAAAAAEILQLRNMTRAEWGTKTPLKQPIPVADDKRGVPSLTGAVSTMADDENLRETLLSDAVQEKLTKGHGGKMAEQIRKQVQEQVRDLDNAALSPELYQYPELYTNSIGGEMKRLEQRAAELANDKKFRNQEPNEAEVRKIVSQYYILSQAAGPKNVNANRDAPWRALDEISTPEMQKQVLSDLMGEDYAKNGFRKDMTDILEDIADYSPEMFVRDCKRRAKQYELDKANNKGTRQAERDTGDMERNTGGMIEF